MDMCLRAAAIALIALSLGNSSAEPASGQNSAPVSTDQVEQQFRFNEAEARKLSADRNWLFDKTNDQEGSGFFAGAERSRHSVLYEVGRGDCLYYFSYRNGVHANPIVGPPQMA